MLIANLEQQIDRLTEMLAGERRMIGSLETDLGAREEALDEARAASRRSGRRWPSGTRR
jgi:hypothetical protein